MFGILKFEKSIEQRLLDEVEKECGYLPVVLRDVKHRRRCGRWIFESSLSSLSEFAQLPVKIRQKIYAAYETPPNLITHTAAEVEAYEKERELAANMPEKLLRRWIGLPPVNPFVSNEMRARFNELMEMARIMEMSKSTMESEVGRLQAVLEELRTFSVEVMQFREYELREQAARTLYAVMKINGYPFRWYSFKRKFVRVFLRFFGYNEVACNVIVEHLIKVMSENEQMKINFLKA